MKNIALNLSALAFGAAMLSPASAAVIGTPVDTLIKTHAKQSIVYEKNFSTLRANLQTWDVSTKDGEYFMALCIEPGVSMQPGKQSYTADNTFTFGTNAASIDRLYGLFYGSASAVDGGKESLSFQLALWELYNDDGTLAVTGTGKLAALETGSNAATTGVYSGAGAVVKRANEMLADVAAGKAYTTLYDYTVYRGANQDFVAATVSAVPEPSTYAMMGLGLALIGLTSRRRSKR